LQRYGCLTGRRTRDDSFRMYCERSGNVAKEHLQQRAVGEDQLFGRHASGQTIRASWQWIVSTESCLDPETRFLRRAQRFPHVRCVVQQALSHVEPAAEHAVQRVGYVVSLTAHEVWSYCPPFDVGQSPRRFERAFFLVPYWLHRSLDAV